MKKTIRRFHRFLFSLDGMIALCIIVYVFGLMGRIVEAAHEICHKQAIRAALHRDPVSPSFSPTLGR